MSWVRRFLLNGMMISLLGSARANQCHLGSSSQSSEVCQTCLLSSLCACGVAGVIHLAHETHERQLQMCKYLHSAAMRQ